MNAEVADKAFFFTFEGFVSLGVQNKMIKTEKKQKNFQIETYFFLPYKVLACYQTSQKRIGL